MGDELFEFFFHKIFVDLTSKFPNLTAHVSKTELSLPLFNSPAPSNRMYIDYFVIPRYWAENILVNTWLIIVTLLRVDKM